VVPRSRPVSPRFLNICYSPRHRSDILPFLRLGRRPIERSTCFFPDQPVEATRACNPFFFELPFYEILPCNWPPQKTVNAFASSHCIPPAPSDRFLRTPCHKLHQTQTPTLCGQWSQVSLYLSFSVLRITAGVTVPLENSRSHVCGYFVVS